MRDTDAHTADARQDADVQALLEAARAAICAQPPRGREALAAVRALAPFAEAVSATEAVDLLERASAFGQVDVVDAVWDAFDGDFAYTGWALALALRCACEDAARDLLSRGVDLLGDFRKPRKLRALMPHEGTFTRFDLTRESPTLFLNNMDHTVSTEVFEPFTGVEQLAGKSYARKTSVSDACACVYRIARDGLFDATVFDDLFRAAVVRAWHALRHPTSRDPQTAEACFDLGRRMLALHRTRGMGDANVELVLGNLVVPRADRAVVGFVCKNAPDVFLGRMMALDWLRADVDLLRAMVPLLGPGTPAQNAELLRIMAAAGHMQELQTVAAWPHALDPASADAAIQAASAAGHAEAATWLLARKQGMPAHAATGEKDARPAVAAPINSSTVTPSQRVGAPATPAAEPTTEAAPAAEPTAATEVSPDATGDHRAEREDLARRVVDLARGLIVAENPFLASSFALLDLVPAHMDAAFSTDGRAVSFDVNQALAAFTATREAPTHDLMHVLVHCLMLHPFVGATVDRAAWDLAADIVAEALAAEVVGPRDDDRGRHIEAALDLIESTLGARITTERLYHALRRGAFQNARADWQRLFLVDDHASWYPAQSQSPAQPGAAEKDADNASDGASQGSAPTGPQAGGSTQAADGDASQGAEPAETQSPDADGASGRTPQPAGSGYRDGMSDGADGPNADARASRPDRRQAEEAWRREAKSIRVNLQTLSRKRGSKLGRFVGELEVSTHEQVDYRDFLRQFAVQSEEMRLSDDEFDYVFYTYGLSLYGDMPLIEPLEYRDEKRIRDFVIVIDTSSSVTQDVVQQFVNTTFDVLTSESSFFQKVNVHIIQADQRVQSDAKITSLAELDRWRRNIKLFGFGGTDFRPAFTYVSDLLAAGEFDDLSGLIYFTDGWGIYPDRMPPYKTTFVFYDEDHRPELVPAWAMQITLHPGEFESMSVY
ncbi:VWA-like domain-containing protein [Parafannyhessea umbonata]|uniref:VWA-like domain-containing protein n=1 Tax=Parafannyhessea umbonata TaxID=604330 RepID=UPI0026EA0528|nr:VWA-like domain-containing protein [Parafannyhessea umbonata]MDD7199844.1 VWA-like domain-containing protein [Parafannyhessea umbonata]MDY4417832.1 VWA-like domain-containing protein [Parafannyhessea umbonata]